MVSSDDCRRRIKRMEGGLSRALKDSLPTEWTVEQTQAWTELQEFLNESQYRDELKEAVRPFWNMVSQKSMSPGEWHATMGTVLERAIAAQRAGLAKDSLEVQRVVDEWIGHFAKALGQSVNDTFMTRFAHYAEQVTHEPNRRLWDLMVRLNPDKMKPSFDAQQLMLEGLRWRQSQIKD